MILTVDPPSRGLRTLKILKVKLLMSSNSLYQLINEPANIRNDSMSCIDLIITDQPNMFAVYGVHPSLDIHCQHQIICGNLNLSFHSPPPYSRTVWHYSRANMQSILNSINILNWVNSLNHLGPSDMVEYFTSTLYKLCGVTSQRRVLGLVIRIHLS